MSSLHVYKVETGEAFVLDIQSNATINALRTVLSKPSGIEPSDMIFICENKKLDHDAQLRTMAEEGIDREVYLFDRRRVAEDAELPAPCTLPQVEISVPSSPSILSGSELKKMSPLVRALYEFEAQFRHHVKVAKIYKKACSTRLSIAEECINQQSRQRAGLKQAVSNLQEHRRQIVKAFGGFLSYFQRQKLRHTELLSTFESDLEKLGETEVSDGVTLLDFVSREKLSGWRDQCSASHVQLCEKVETMQTEIDEIAQEVEKNILTQIIQIDADQGFTKRWKTAQELCEETASIIEILDRDSGKPTELIAKSNRRTSISDLKLSSEDNELDTIDSSSRIRSFDMGSELESLEQLQEIHETQQLAKMKENDSNLFQFCTDLANAKTTLTRKIHYVLQRVAKFQTTIRDLGNRIAVYTEAMIHLKNSFQELVRVRKMPDAFKASVTELVRRRQAKAILNSEIGILNEFFEKWYKNEEAHRAEFLGEHGPFVLKEVLPELSERTPLIKIDSFEQELGTLEPLSEESASVHKWLVDRLGTLIEKEGKEEAKGTLTEGKEEGKEKAELEEKRAEIDDKEEDNEKTELEEKRAEIDDKEKTELEAKRTLCMSIPKIRYNRFEANDIALFVWRQRSPRISSSKTGYYEAYNQSCPYYILSEESESSIIERRDLVLAQIVEILEMTSTGPTDPYGLPAGIKYHLVHASLVGADVKVVPHCRECE